jgi:RNA polymerase sigma-70 factor (ECF subfamily)
MITDSDEVLVRSAQGGDRLAFEELVRRTSRLVFARLYLETGDAHRAEDLLQETLLCAFRSLGELVDPKGFRPWLLKIAQNAFLDAARRDSRKKRAARTRIDVTALYGVASKDPSPADQVVREDLRRQLLAILRSLPEEYRLPLTLRYMGGCDYETIQTQLGLSNGALRGLLHRGLKLLRARLPRDFENNFGERGA